MTISLSVYIKRTREIVPGTAGYIPICGTHEFHTTWEPLARRLNLGMIEILNVLSFEDDECKSEFLRELDIFLEHAPRDDVHSLSLDSFVLVRRLISNLDMGTYRVSFG